MAIELFIAYFLLAPFLFAGLMYLHFRNRLKDFHVPSEYPCPKCNQINFKEAKLCFNCKKPLWWQKIRLGHRFIYWMLDSENYYGVKWGYWLYLTWTVALLALWLSLNPQSKFDLQAELVDLRHQVDIMLASTPEGSLNSGVLFILQYGIYCLQWALYLLEGWSIGVIAWTIGVWLAYNWFVAQRDKD
jgi:hypothetical protein